MQFIVSTTDEVLIPQAGLGLVGALLQHTKLRQRIDALDVEGCRRPEVQHGDVIAAAIGLLCLGKSDFNDIETFRKDTFFRRSLGLRQIPSEPTLRQRLDAIDGRCAPILHEESALLLRKLARRPTPCHGEWVALDVDVSPFDNSNTKKEGVSWTYKKVDGFAPIFAYLGEEGYEVHCQLREGKQHCQDGTPRFLDEALGYAEQITRSKLLVRLDSGNDAIENIRVCRKHKADYIIKRNLRKESPEDWLEEAQCHGECEEPREGKEVWTGQTWRQRDGKPYRVVFEVILRTTEANGQKLLVPEIEVNTWWTSLRLPAKQVIELYHAHGTSEQYHSEIKTDLDLERLPSGKFATNATMLSLGLVAYNLLRLCGQEALHEQRRLPAQDRAPLGKKVFRRRLRSVIQDLMYMSAKLTRHANRWRLSLWRNSPWGATWRGLYARFCGVPIIRSG
jgi:Transposase DDE domain group 1